ncbi:MAG: hypothetical protein KF858_15115 [Candidatus Sumerlaeia bacterium]|nr:hypothetical protein [Candidatus Sumerlaeia bacterium]
MLKSSIWIAVFAIAVTCARAAPLNVPSDGSDGVLDRPASNVHLDLSEAVTGTWNDPVPESMKGKGIYDPVLWAVVYKYESVNVGFVSFGMHPTGAPVVWLVQGDVVIHGNVNLNGDGSQPGPGGFRGGDIVTGHGYSGGYGPGGGQGISGSGGSYATPGLGDGSSPDTVYGNAKVFPLIGGSGGSGHSGRFGGGGGGAIVIVAGGTIDLRGSIHANGGAGAFGGAGGGIRLVADRIIGTGNLRAQFGSGDIGNREGGMGRIRLEANTISLVDQGYPVASRGLVDEPLRIFPDSSTPSIRPIKLDGRLLGSDPRVLLPSLEFRNPGDYELEIEGFNVPLDSVVVARTVPGGTSTATLVGGDLGHSIWRATVTLVDGTVDIQVRANLP